ncbi:MAG: nucleotidyltransferase [Candidatus Methanomarinus sp.]|uniref:Nucleotidyltransferase n=1 Tax=Candidatus Methanomarinus sp. TaxID=3386244 RepID=A0AC61SC65_9EURY|nr:MAG: nucleotidyltransferase [ANME-2 cluster archaeon]
MAKTILESFKKLKANLEITGLQHSTVSTRQQNVRKVIENELDVLDSFLTGSYSRHTMIAPLSEADIDIFVILNPSYYEEDGQVNLLDRVKRVLLKTYTKTPKISRNGQAVTITFANFVVDVVPAFNRKDGGFLIPNSIKKEWISTNPKTHVEIMSNENDKHDGNLIPIVKMIKGWNKNINHAYVSFYLELLAINIFTNVTISDYSSGLRYFFDKGREVIKYKVKDPVEYGGQINGLDNVSTIEEAVSRFETAYMRDRLSPPFIH